MYEHNNSKFDIICLKKEIRNDKRKKSINDQILY